MKEYVLSFDVAKGKSKAGLFAFDRERGMKEVLRPLDYGHSDESLGKLMERLGSIPLAEIAAVMESTYVYQDPLISFLKGKGFGEIIVFNPQSIKKSDGSIRKTKNDRLDCGKIARFYFRNEWTRPSERSAEENELRIMSRHLDSLRKQQSRVKCQIRRYITDVFPELEEIADENNALFSDGFVNLLEKYGHAVLLRNRSLETIASAWPGREEGLPSMMNMRRGSDRPTGKAFGPFLRTRWRSRTSFRD